MARYIQRHSTLKRVIHGIHMAATMILFITGLFIFVPSLGRSLGEAMYWVHWIHRFAGATFVAVPLIGMIIAPKGAVHFFKSHFAKWDADDVEFMKRFPKYLFMAKKTHMPKQSEIKSGQRAADLMIVLFSVIIGISGIVLWIAAGQGEAAMDWARMLHGIAFIALLVLISAHLYLGAGIYQPYRGLGRLMFGDGKVKESDALYHWGHWAEEELKSGKNVVVVDE